ncbi:MAG: homogentisate 1,2-dioxygenase, partial [Acidimicrobiia bacterium]
MTYYQRQGTVPAKRFTELRTDDGTLAYEELITSLGFLGPSSLLYRRHQPTRVLRTTVGQGPMLRHGDDGVVRNRLLKVADVRPGLAPVAEPPIERAGLHLVRSDPSPARDELASRIPLYFNDDFVYSVSRPASTEQRFQRNGFADEVLAVVNGTGVIETMFGELAYRPLDIIYIPRATTWRLVPHDDVEQLLVVIETSSPCGPPAHYRNSSGQYLPRAIYAERDLRVPVLQPPVLDGGEFVVSVKTGDVVTDHVMANHPFDVVGWDGALYPYAFNMSDIETLSGRVHLMPDMHQVLVSAGVMICAITPGRLPDHRSAYPAQADHTADCDEIYYRFCTDDGSAIPGIGTITMHTRAAAHGPKPGFENKRLPERSPIFG